MQLLYNKNWVNRGASSPLYKSRLGCSYLLSLPRWADQWFTIQCNSELSALPEHSFWVGLLLLFYLKGLGLHQVKNKRTGGLISNSAGLLQQAGGDKARKENSKKLTLRLAVPPCLFFKPLNHGNLISRKKVGKSFVFPGFNFLLRCYHYSDLWTAFWFPTSSLGQSWINWRGLLSRTRNLTPH